MIVPIFTLFSLFVTPLLLAFGEDLNKMEQILRVYAWVVDISWTIHIFLNFFTADAKHRTFKRIGYQYLTFWFWIDAISTFPSMIFEQ